MNRQVRSDAAFFDTLTQTPMGKGPATVQTSYNDNWQAVTKTDDNNHIKQYAYDRANRLATATDAKSNNVSYAYDANGNVISTTETDRSDLGNPMQTFVTHFA